MNEVTALKIDWTFGFSKDISGSVHSLTTKEKNALLFLSSHSAVIYDYEFKTQFILQGHKNIITCCAVSTDKRWIVTADEGDDCLVVIWDALAGVPARTIFNPHSRGIVSVDISRDSLFVTTLSSFDAGGGQEVSIFAWTQEEGGSPIFLEKVPAMDPQHSIRFDTSNQSELCCTGNKTVCFWSWDTYHLESYVTARPPTLRANLTRTVFLPHSNGSAVTSDDDGHVIIWESRFAAAFLEDPASASKLMRSASKIIKVSDASINCMEVVNEYVCIGCGDGVIKFYDFSLRLEAWFEDVQAGPITSLSFSMQESPFADSAGAPGLRFWAPNFIIGTSEAFVVGVESECFHEIQAEDRRGTLLMQGMTDDVTAAACDPTSSLVVIACYSGMLQIWDYENKLLVMVRDFNNEHIDSRLRTRSSSRLHLNKDHVFLRPLCLAFEPEAEFLVVGFSSGIIKFINSRSLEDIASFAPSTSPIQTMLFSDTSNYLGGYDTSNHVILFGRIEETANSVSELDFSDTKRKSTFEYIGRVHSHSAAIIGIAFGSIQGSEVLISASKDRRIVEYDCDKSSSSDGVVCYGEGKLDNKPIRIELTARPAAIMWLPPDNDIAENKFIVANDQFKFKEFNADTNKCRKVTMCPLQGGHPVILKPLRHPKLKSTRASGKATSENEVLTLDDIEQVSEAEAEAEAETAESPPLESDVPSAQNSYYAYATQERMIGIACLPLTGNPDLTSAVVAHPGKVTSLAVSHDGKFMFSCGGSDLSVNMWAIDVSTFDPYLELASSTAASDRIAPYLGMLDGGQDGVLYNDLVDYFYYFQLRRQGEDAIESRIITDSIAVDNIPEIMNAIGLYSSQEDFSNMMNEIRYSNFVFTGELQNDISLEELIKLYLNHRPIEPLLDVDVQNAFNIVCSKFNGGSELAWKDLRTILTTEGERMVMSAVHECMSALAEPAMLKQMESTTLDSSLFATAILGFDELNRSSLAFEDSLAM